MERSERRKMLQSQEKSSLRGHKNLTFRPKEQKEILPSLITHIQKMLVCEFHHTLIAVTLLNEHEILEQLNTKQSGTLECHINVTTKHEKNTDSQELTLPVPFEKKQYEKHVEYFESIIQVRCESNDRAKEIMDELEKNGLRIAKIVEQKTGIDLYVDDNHRAYSIMQQFKRKCGGTLQRSKRLQGVDQLASKKRYRTTILYRNP